jgi:hypothetical protein
MKLEFSGAANGWQTTNSKPPGPIIVIEESKIGNSSKIIFIILLSSRCTALLRFLPASASKLSSTHKPFSRAKKLSFHFQVVKRLKTYDKDSLGKTFFFFF